MADVYAAIDGFIAEETEGLTEEDIAEGFTGDTGWYEIQKWEQQTGDDGQPHLGQYRTEKMRNKGKCGKI